jgi:hypothetical protein
VSRVVIFGGYGTFGGHVARELARVGETLTIAGRDGERAGAFAAALGPTHRGIAANVSQPADCRAALAGATIAVNCAGPFRAGDTALLEACLEIGCHYADIADDRGYAARVRDFGERFAAKGLAAVYGCSSLPGISGALALAAGANQPMRARVTLFIGNNNPKGRAAVASLAGGLGRPIGAPQGELRGFRDREIVPLPPPFGPRPVFNFDSPDYDLLPKLVGVRSVSVKLGFELRLATYGFAALARLPIRFGVTTTRLLNLPARLLAGIGSSGGAVMTELFAADGSVRWAAVVARRDGQRMASLPCAYAVQTMAGGTSFRGAGTVYDLIGADVLLRRLAADGFKVHMNGEPGA